MRDIHKASSCLSSKTQIALLLPVFIYEATVLALT